MSRTSYRFATASIKAYPSLNEMVPGLGGTGTFRQLYHTLHDACVSEGACSLDARSHTRIYSKVAYVLT